MDRGIDYLVKNYCTSRGSWLSGCNVTSPSVSTATTELRKRAGPYRILCVCLPYWTKRTRGRRRNAAKRGPVVRLPKTGAESRIPHTLCSMWKLTRDCETTCRWGCSARRCWVVNIRDTALIWRASHVLYSQVQVAFIADSVTRAMDTEEAGYKSMAGWRRGGGIDGVVSYLELES